MKFKKKFGGHRPRLACTVAKKVQVEMGKIFLIKFLEARPRARAVPGAAGRRGELSWTRQNFFGEDQNFSYICICDAPKNIFWRGLEFLIPCLRWPRGVGRRVPAAPHDKFSRR